MAEPPMKKVQVIKVGGSDGFQISIFSNIAKQKENLAKFSRKGVLRATYRALNKAGGKTNTQLKRDISNSFNLAQKEFKANLSAIKAGPQRLSYTIRGIGRLIPIIRAKGAKKQTALGVRINTGSGSRVLRGHFIATMASGHTGIFRRKDNAKHRPGKNLTTGVSQTRALAITERTFPSVAHMIANPKRGDRMFSFFIRDYPKQLFAQLNNESERAGGTKVSARTIAALTG